MLRSVERGREKRSLHVVAGNIVPGVVAEGRHGGRIAELLDDGALGVHADYHALQGIGIGT